MAIVRFRFSSRRVFRTLIVCLAFIALFPPIFFHLRLKRFHQIRLRKCGWLNTPPLVCAHGGDSTKAFPNTIAAYKFALSSRVDCIEIDVSRSRDGVLFALHDRQGFAANIWKQYFKGWALEHERDKRIRWCSSICCYGENIAKIEDALKLVSNSVLQVILDAKVGPPSYEKGLAKDILSV